MEMTERRRLLLERLMSGAVQLRDVEVEIPLLDRDQPLPLSAAQKRILFVQGLYPNACFNGSLVLKHTGAINPEQLRTALTAAIGRHEVLRTNAFYTTGGAFGRINAPTDVDLAISDLRGLPTVSRRSEAVARGKEIVNEPFDLFTSPTLLRAGLVILDDRESLVVLAMHMFAFDAPSGILFAKDLIESYKGGGRALEEPAFQYADYVAWAAKQPSVRTSSDLDYWVKQLAGGDAELLLPTDRGRASNLDFSAQRFPFQLELDLVERLKRLGQEHGATFYMVALAALMVLLQRHSGAPAISVGTWTVTRDNRTADLVGPFVNTLVHRAPIAPGESFVDLLAKVRSQALAGYARAQVPFDDVVSALNPVRSAAINPLFQVHFLLQETGTTSASEGFSLSDTDALIGASGGYDVELVLRDLDRGVEGHVECNASLFSDRATERFALRYLEVLSVVCDEPRRSLGTLQFSDDCMARAVGPEPEGLPLQCHLERIRSADPDSIAIITRDGNLNYRELQSLVALFCRQLSVAPDDALLVLDQENGPVLFAGMVAALWQGIPFVSLGPKPAFEKLDWLQDISTIITLDVPGSDETLIELDQAASVESQAYFAFSSGSTGNSSLTAISRGALANVISEATRLYSVDAGTRLLQTTLPAFDVLIEEVMPVLCAGGTLVVSDHLERGLGVLSELANTHQVTTMNLSSALSEAWLKDLAHSNMTVPETLSLLVVGSDSPSIQSLLQWRELAGDSVRLLNAYGTTETAITCSTFEFGDLSQISALPRTPIGQPLAGFEMAVIDAADTIVPPAVVGELVVSGIGLGTSLDRNGKPDGAKKLGMDGRVWFRTGDLARLRDDGAFELLGRIQRSGDESNEDALASAIATLANQDPDVLTSCCKRIGKDFGTATELKIWPRQEVRDDPALLTALKSRLAVALADAGFDKIQLSFVNGRSIAEKRALPDGTEDQLLLWRLWREAVGAELESLELNLFEMGATSLDCLVFVGACQSRGIKLEVADIYANPTFSSLASSIAYKDFASVDMRAKI